MAFSSAEFRRVCTEADAKRDAGLTTPDDVERSNDIPYGADEKWQILDVYRPKNAKNEKLPVIVSVHGGGWVYGTKETYQFYCMDLAQRGFAVVNFNYRLAPENKFPAAVQDTNSVFEWVVSNSEKYGFDLERVFAVGDSAGAQNLAIFACAVENGTYASKLGITPPKGLKLRALGLNCGLYDLRKPVTKDMGFIPEALENGGTAEELELMSPAAFMTGAFPPSYLLSSNCDFLKKQTRQLDKTLKKLGVEHETRIYGSVNKRLYHVFHCNIKTKDAKRANDDECAFFKRILQ